MWAALFWNEGATRRERNGERVTGWEGETGEKRVSRGSEWMECAVEAQWMSCTLCWGVLQVLYRGSRGHSGCDWHQNNISWQTTLVKGRGQATTCRPHLEYQQLFFLRWILNDWQCLFSMLFAWYKRRNCTYGKDATRAGSKRCLQNFSVEFWKYMLWVFLHTWRVDYPILFLFKNLAYTNIVSEISAVMHVCCIHSEAVYCTKYKTKQKTSVVCALMLWEQWSLWIQLIIWELSKRCHCHCLFKTKQNNNKKRATAFRCHYLKFSSYPLVSSL